MHRSLEALGRGRSGDGLRAFVTAVAAEEELEPAHAAELLPLIERVAASEAWKSLTRNGLPQVELTVMQRTESGGVEAVTEGVIDAAMLDADGWRILDWKTDLVDDEGWKSRSAKYAQQVDAYVRMLASLTGEKATGRVERVRA